MELRELKEILSEKDEFRDIASWKLKGVNHGSVGIHSSIISKGKKKYFVKDIKDNEANALSLIYPLKLKHLIKVAYPDLLSRNVLVAEYIRGKPISSKNLSAGLIKDFAAMQNALNNPRLFANKKYFSANRFIDKDDGFFIKGYRSLWAQSRDTLNSLKRRYNLKIIDNYLSLMIYLDKYKEEIINECSKMPFAWQHHDFREGNIIGKKQILVDFGSSYGHGPFLFDLAPFLINNQSALKTFIKNSDICKKYSNEKILRWIYIATAINMNSRIKYHFESPKSLNETKEFLEYEWKTHKYLLNFI